MIKTNIIYNLDARQLLNTIKLPLVDLIITSPPYADLKNYGTRDQIGFGQNYEMEYLPALKNVFFQCYATTKENGAMWIVVDTFKKYGQLKLLPFDVARICAECGWILRDIIIWDKGKTLPWSHKGQLRNRFEYILFFTKTNNYKYYVDRIKDPIDLKEWWVKYPERYSQKEKNP
ncbi:MAG: site-specific DNA-methyltransferase [bacterium]